MIYSAIISFTQFDLLTPPKFIGAANFNRMVHDKLFYISLGNTAYYTFISVPLQIVLALAMALVLNQKLRGINTFRTIFYLPTVTPDRGVCHSCSFTCSISISGFSIGC